MPHMTRHPLRAKLVLGSVVTSLIAVGTIALTTRVANAAPAVVVRSITQYGPDSGGQFQLLGEIENVGTTAIGPVSIDVSFFDGPNATGNILFQDNAFTNVDALAPGGLTPFQLTFPRLAGYQSFGYVVNDGGGGVVNHNFTVTVKPCASPAADHVCGTVRNDNTTTAQFVSVVGTGYDASNRVAGVDTDYVQGASSDIAAGGTAPFELIFAGVNPVLVAQSSTAPAPSASPSPSPSPAGGTTGGATTGTTGATTGTTGATTGTTGATTGTTTGSATGGGTGPTTGGPVGTGGPSGITPPTGGTISSPSPTATSPSPAPSPAASGGFVPTAAKPCGNGGGNYFLRISPAAAVIRRGSTVTLAARLLQNGRICQAGLPVAMYTRGPGTTLFHISRTLTTDAQGLVRTSYARPAADFRWYVRYSTTLSGVGLVQVR